MTGLKAGAQRSWRPRCLGILGLLASLLGSQGLASSSPQGAEVVLLLAAGHPWSAPSDGLRRGYGLAIEQA